MTHSHPRGSRLSLTNLSVDFGPTRALDNVSLSIEPGEIVGLLGHNGAGKTTLFNVVSGAIAASSGSFAVEGEEFSSDVTPRLIASRGVTVLYQDPALAGNLSVVENLFLGERGRITKTLRASARDALERVGAQLDLDQPVSTLSLGDMQLVALARGSLSADMKVLLLDEPTAALGISETNALHDLIKSFAATGVAVVYVSHRLPDILNVCQRIVILSAGQVIADGAASEFDGASLARALAPELISAEKASPTVSDRTVSVQRGREVIEVREGEVVGLFGMAGGEQFEVLEKLFGLRGRFSFNWDGRLIEFKSPVQAMKYGVHFVPPDREREGLIGGMSAIDNVFAPWFRFTRHRGWWIGRSAGSNEYVAARKELNVQGPDGRAVIDQFSGGNRQKHLLSRWMFVNTPRLLLLAQPTQGVDVGAKADIVRSVRRLAKEGAAVLVASAESDEIATLCDRAYVFHGDHHTPVQSDNHFDEKLLDVLLTKTPSLHTTKERG